LYTSISEEHAASIFRVEGSCFNHFTPRESPWIGAGHSGHGNDEKNLNIPTGI
jgi:hypothetical protein